MFKSKDLFPLFLLGFAALLIFKSIGYPWQAQTLPTLFGSIVILLIILQLMIEKNKRLHARLGFLVNQEVMDDDSDEVVEENEAKDENNNIETEADDRLVTMKELGIIGWLILLVGLIYYMPYYVAVPIFLFLFCKLFTKLSWRNTFLVTIIMTSFMYVLFSLVLNVQII